MTARLEHLHRLHEKGGAGMSYPAILDRRRFEPNWPMFEALLREVGGAPAVNRQVQLVLGAHIAYLQQRIAAIQRVNELIGRLHAHAG